MTKVKTIRKCKAENCKFNTTSMLRLQKHYLEQHSLKERVKDQLVISGNEHLTISGIRIQGGESSE